jgi:hypothetical protein
MNQGTFAGMIYMKFRTLSKNFNPIFKNTSQYNDTIIIKVFDVSSSNGLGHVL